MEDNGQLSTRMDESIEMTKVKHNHEYIFATFVLSLCIIC